MNTMSLQELVELADVHGGDLARWPQERREAAMHVLAGDHAAAARAALDRARVLDAQLALYVPPPPSAELRRALLTQPHRGGWLSRLWHEFGGVRVAGPAFALALAAGVGLAEVTAPIELEPPGVTEEDDLIGVALLEADYDAFDGDAP